MGSVVSDSGGSAASDRNEASPAIPSKEAARAQVRVLSGGAPVCRQIRRKPSTRDLPVIMVTAMHDISIALEAIRAGAYDYILKPFEKDQLHLSVRRALEHRQLVIGEKLHVFFDARLFMKFINPENARQNKTDIFADVFVFVIKLSLFIGLALPIID